MTTSAPIPGPGFDPQPPPAPEALPSTLREVDAGLAQPFADGPVREEIHVFEQVESAPLTQAEADALVGQPLDLSTASPYVEGSDPGEEALDAGPDYTGLAEPGIDYAPFGADAEPDAEPGVDYPSPPFESEHRKRAEALLAGRNGPATYNNPGHPESPQDATTLALAYAVLGLIEVLEHQASFLRA